MREWLKNWLFREEIAKQKERDRDIYWKWQRTSVTATALTGLASTSLSTPLRHLTNRLPQY